jgi:surface carbohydrate biosynthesis protein (TIGR04326 family)
LVNKHSTLLIWDCDEKILEWEGPVFLWRSFDESARKDSRSIPMILEKESEYWREKFLALIYEFGYARNGSKNVIEQMELEKGFSYWWLSLMAQKDIIQYSLHLYDILKLLVTEDQVRRMPYAISAIHVKSDHKGLVTVLRKWATTQSYIFSAESVQARSLKQKLINSVPFRITVFVKGLLILFKFIVQRISLRAVGNTLGANRITFFDVFTHLNTRSFETGRFESNYWTILVDFFKKEGIGVNWFHWFFKHKFIKTIPDAMKLARKFNGSDPGMHHVVGDARISIGQCFRMIGLFWRINWMSLKIKHKSRKAIVSGSDMNFWPILKIDWYESFFGARAYLNLISVIVIKDFIKKTPRQSLGFYIQENQPWEFTICYYWKKYGHGKLISVAHTTIPFWDLRYYYDTRSFQPGGYTPPFPNLMAVNGKDAYQKMKAAGFPTEKLIELEALRYMHLGDSVKKINRPRKRTLRLLVLGDLVPKVTNSQLSFLNRVIDHYNLQIDVVFKPHPASNETPESLVKNMEVSHRSMGEELTRCDVVFVNNVTSGAADPYQMGVPLIVLNLGININFSPLFSRDDVFFVSNTEEFYKAFVFYQDRPQLNPPDFFNTDASLTKWKELIFQAVAQE